jgi:hypothetical protein
MFEKARHFAGPFVLVEIFLVEEIFGLPVGHSLGG